MTFIIILSQINYLISIEHVSGMAYVTDGDTIKLDNIKIRLYGIDAPELGQYCNGVNMGEEARVYLKKLVENKEVNCQIHGTDMYKRKLGRCFLKSGDIEINKRMVEVGFAVNYHFYSKDYVKEEYLAKRKNIGIWLHQCMNPYKYRKQNRKKNRRKRDL